MLVHSVNSESHNWFCYTVFPEYRHDSVGEADSDLHSKAEVDQIFSLQRLESERVDEVVMATDETVFQDESELEPLTDSDNADTGQESNDKDSPSDNSTDDTLLDLPQLSAEKYLNDQEFQGIYQYLMYGKLTGENEQD